MPPKAKPENTHLTEAAASETKTKKKGIQPTEAVRQKAPVSPAKLKAALRPDAAAEKAHSADADKK